MKHVKKAISARRGSNWRGFFRRFTSSNNAVVQSFPMRLCLLVSLGVSGFTDLIILPKEFFDRQPESARDLKSIRNGMEKGRHNIQKGTGTRYYRRPGRAHYRADRYENTWAPCRYRLGPLNVLSRSRSQIEGETFFKREATVEVSCSTARVFFLRPTVRLSVDLDCALILGIVARGHLDIMCSNGSIFVGCDT